MGLTVTVVTPSHLLQFNGFWVYNKSYFLYSENNSSPRFCLEYVQGMTRRERAQRTLHNAVCAGNQQYPSAIHRSSGRRQIFGFRLRLSWFKKIKSNQMVWINCVQKKISLPFLSNLPHSRRRCGFIVLQRCYLQHQLASSVSGDLAPRKDPSREFPRLRYS